MEQSHHAKEDGDRVAALELFADACLASGDDLGLAVARAYYRWMRLTSAARRAADAVNEALTSFWEAGAALLSIITGGQ